MNLDENDDGVWDWGDESFRDAIHLLHAGNQQGRGPQCPVCGGRLPGIGYERCCHCRAELGWVQEVPCKKEHETALMSEALQVELAEREQAALHQRLVEAERLRFNREMPRFFWPISALALAVGWSVGRLLGIHLPGDFFLGLGMTWIWVACARSWAYLKAYRHTAKPALKSLCFNIIIVLISFIFVAVCWV